jgi:hypothetical protein
MKLNKKRDFETEIMRTLEVVLNSGILNIYKYHFFTQSGSDGTSAESLPITGAKDVYEA